MGQSSSYRGEGIAYPILRDLPSPPPLLAAAWDFGWRTTCSAAINPTPSMGSLARDLSANPFPFHFVPPALLRCLRRYMTLVTVEPMPNLHKITARPIFALRRERVFHSRTLSVCLFLIASVTLAAARDLAIVSNKVNSLSSITLPDLVKLGKGQTNHWPDGKPVTFIMFNPSTPEMKLFLEKVYELPEAQVKEVIATANQGRAGHPAIMIVDSDEDLIEKIASLPGAVGVVDVYAINSSVAVVKLAGKLPLEPGYLLHGN